MEILQGGKFQRSGGSLFRCLIVLNLIFMEVIQ